jgi:hypothetical protein
MTTLPVTPAPRASGGFWRRTLAMLIKEFIQLKRDRVSFAMIVMIPLVQLLLFGYAINTNPRHLPTAVLLQEQSDLGRSILKAIQNTAYFDVTHIVHDETEFDRLLASGAVLFAIEIPATATGRRCWSPPTRPTPWPPARPWPRSAHWCRPRSCTTVPFPTARERRSRSALMPATTRRPTPR